MTPLPPGLPQGLYERARAVDELLRPTKPQRVFACLQADLPDPAANTECQAWVRDAKALVVSDGSAWIRTDTGAPI